MSDVKNVSEYLSHFPLGFARSNRYVVTFMMPPGINETGSWMNNESSTGRIGPLGNNLNRDGAVDISCHTATLPGRTLMTYPLTQHSAPFNVPYSQMYDPVTFSFYASAHLDQRHFFDVWQTAVVNLNDNSLNFFDEYTQDVEIWQLDREGNRTYGVKLYAAWPLSNAEVPYSYATNNQVVDISVTLSFKLWKAKPHDTTTIVIY
jgi:hypothetical protein